MTDLYGEQAAETVRTDTGVRCTGCNKLLAEMASRPWIIKCPRCKELNSAGLTLVKG